MISHGKNVKVFSANANKSLAEGICRTNCRVFSFLKKWRLQIAMLIMGETAVASAAPASPRPMGNMKI